MIPPADRRHEPVDLRPDENIRECKDCGCWTYREDYCPRHRPRPEEK